MSLNAVHRKIARLDGSFRPAVRACGAFLLWIAHYAASIFDAGAE
jgi:hypothetical protein